MCTTAHQPDMRLLLLILGLLLTRPGQAQERVRNVRLRVADSSTLEIQYDLINARPGDSIYLEVRSRLRGALRIGPEFVRGDVGKRIVAGSDRRIIWNALANGYSLNEEVRATVLVKTGLPLAPQPPRPAEAIAQPDPGPDRSTLDGGDKPRRDEPVAVTPRPTPTDAATPAVQPPISAPSTQTDVGQPDTVATQRRRYAGPAWALLSAVAPGFGNIFVQTPRPKIGLRPLLAVSCYGLLVYGLQERQKSRDAYAIYQEQKNAETGEPHYQTANDYHHRYYLATRGAIVIAAADVILTFVKGLRNGRAVAANRPLPSVTLRPGLQVGQPTAVVRYSF